MGAAAWAKFLLTYPPFVVLYIMGAVLFVQFGLFGAALATIAWLLTALVVSQTLPPQAPTETLK